MIKDKSYNFFTFWNYSNTYSICTATGFAAIKDRMLNFYVKILWRFYRKKHIIDFGYKNIVEIHLVCLNYLKILNQWKMVKKLF